MTSLPVQYPADPRGQCVLLENSLCSIFAVKPFEYAEFIHCDPDASKCYQEVLEAWNLRLARVEELRCVSCTNEMFYIE